MKEFCTLDGIITLVDAKHVVQHLDDEKPEGAENEAVEQVAFADRLILNKCDLVPEESELKKVEDRLRAINKFAPIVRSTQAKVSADQVLNIKAFDLEKTLEMDPEFLNTEGEHEHDATVTSVGITVDGEVDLGKFNAWLEPIVTEKGVDIYRMKGVIAIYGDPNKYVYHAVHMIFSGAYTDPWGMKKRCCKLMFIGKNLDTGRSWRGASRRAASRAGAEEAEDVGVGDPFPAHRPGFNFDSCGACAAASSLSCPCVLRSR